MRSRCAALWPSTAPAARKFGVVPSGKKLCVGSHRARGTRGHLDSELAHAELGAAATQPPTFMDLDGPRFVHCSDSPGGYDELLQRLKNWRL